MKKKMIIIFLVTAGFISIPAQDKNNELLTIATFVVGDVVSNRAGKILKVTKNFIFLTGDEVITKKGTVDIQVGPGSIIRVANNTTIKIARILEANQKQNVNIGLTKGKVFSKVSPKMPPGSTFEISSPTITAGVRGTEFLVSEETGEDSQEKSTEIPEGVFVKEGEVAVKVTANDSVKDFTVKTGEEVVVTTKGILKQILEDHVKEKMRNLDTLQVMKESSYKSMKELKEKNQDLLNNRPTKIK